MRRTNKLGILAMATLMTVLFAGAIWAQPGQRGGARGGADRGGADRGGADRGGQRGGPGGGFSVENMWERFIAPRLKENVDIEEDEWELIEPLVRDVVTKQFEMAATQRAAQSGGGGFNMFGGRGGRGGRGGEEVEEDPAIAALKKTIENKRARPADIAAKIKAVRASREKAKKEAEAKLKEQEKATAEARKKLREVLTPRQEAQFFLLNILD